MPYPYRRRDVPAEEWLRNISEQPEAVARLLEHEAKWGHLYADENGHVWNGGMGPGFGTSFKLIRGTELSDFAG